MSELQNRIYYLLEELQQMNSKVPSEIQQRIPNEVLSGLATAIASGHIYEIVRGLTEVQQLEEKSLFHQRLELQKKHSDEKVNFKIEYEKTINKLSDSAVVLETTQKLGKEQDEMLKSHQNELENFDISTVLKLDHKVAEQQLTLEQAGVAGFYVTKNPTDIKVQMTLIDFIGQLEKKENNSEQQCLNGTLSNNDSTNNVTYGYSSGNSTARSWW